MLEILEFAFQDFYHFAGCLILLTVCVNALGIFAGLIGGYYNDKNKP